MPAYRHILLASDLSPAGESVARRAADLAQRSRARLTLLHVIEHFPEDLPVGAIAPENEDPKAYLLRRSRSRLEALGQALDMDRIDCQVVTSLYSAKHEVLAYAEQHDVDLIVVGAGAAETVTGLLGSTAAGILNHARCDVLVARSAV
ncbi:MAG TPA: universal stress protein [Gammaproteobacteria bacterium]|nr:universal stress protein [Gammaproteobacteria bacterium]